MTKFSKEKILQLHQVMAKIYAHMVDDVFEQNRLRLEEYARQKDESVKKD